MAVLSGPPHSEDTGGWRPPDAVEVDALCERLRAGNVRAVRVTVVDNAGVHRVKCVPVGRLAAAVSSGLGMSTLLSAMTVSDAFATTRWADPDRQDDDLRLVPDLRGCVPLSAEPGWAWCPADQYTQGLQPWPADPRGFLRRMVDRAADQGLALSAAFETEFYVSRADSGAAPSPGPAYGAIAATGVPFLLDVVDALQAAGVGVQQVHPEFSSGQYEVSVDRADALPAADTAVLVRQVVRGAADGRGLRASFSPKPALDALGSGTHVHFSVWDQGEHNLFAGGDGPFGMTRTGEAFAAGVLAVLPALVCVTAPSTVSYERLRPGLAAGAFQVWGRENREAALRFVTGTSGQGGQAANFEYKPCDGAGNPYLVLGTILAAGLAGVRTQSSLPPPVVEAPAALPEHERRQRGIEPLPATLAEAITALASSSVLAEALGEPMFETFLATRRLEDTTYGGSDPVSAVRAHADRY